MTATAVVMVGLLVTAGAGPAVASPVEGDPDGARAVALQQAVVAATDGTTIQLLGTYVVQLVDVHAYMPCTAVMAQVVWGRVAHGTLSPLNKLATPSVLFTTHTPSVSSDQGLCAVRSSVSHVGLSQHTHTTILIRSNVLLHLFTLAVRDNERNAPRSASASTATSLQQLTLTSIASTNTRDDADERCIRHHTGTTSPLLPS